eukprot:1440086-Rhodomonas_salina.1
MEALQQRNAIAPHSRHTSQRNQQSESQSRPALARERCCRAAEEREQTLQQPPCLHQQSPPAHATAASRHVARPAGTAPEDNA